MEDFLEASGSPACEKGSCSLVITGKNPEVKVFPVDGNKPVTLFPVSVSVQDFRSSDMENGRLEGLSPRRVLEYCIWSLESKMRASKAINSDSNAKPNPKATSNWHGFARLLKGQSIRHIYGFPSVNIPKLSRRKSRNARRNLIPKALCYPEDDNLYCYRSSWKNFTLSELQTATNNFSSENVIGKGGFADVYKGCLEDGRLVAVKRLTGEVPEESIGSFLSELGIIVHVNHPNTAKLIGYGVDGGMYLVLQLSPHGSLASVLHGSKEILNWGIRYKIALGTADGLLYLHESCQRRIIHRDIKTANILLSEDFEPQICDFGLAKWLPEQWTHRTVSDFEGTFGYLAPEYFIHGIVDEKTDVYSFGVLLLELITGRQALDDSQQSLVMWAKALLDRNDIKELVDPSLADAYDPEQMNHVVLTASLCIQQSSILRPQMSKVVKLLRGDEGSLECVKQSQRPSLTRTYSEGFLDSEEYDESNYLIDLNRHNQIALEHVSY